MKKSNLILGFYVGVIALCVATVSMSIAWYASSTQVRLEAIEMTVDCDRELGISVARDGEYKEKLDPEELEQVGLFRPVTAAYSNLWRDTKADMPVFYDEPKFSTYESFGNNPIPANPGGYFSQKLYLKSNDDIFVTLDPTGTYINPNTEYNKGYAEVLYQEYQKGDDARLKAMTVEEIEEGLNNLVKAMRFSILITSEQDYNYAIIDPHKEVDTEYAGLLDVDRDHYYDHFLRGSDSYERLYGEYTGTVIHKDTLPSEDSNYLHPDEAANAFNAKHRKDIKQIDWERSETEGGLEIVKEKSIDVQDFANTTKPFRIPVYRHQPQEIVLSIFIEGWDLDSINHTKGATFLSNITFKIEREQ